MIIESSPLSTVTNYGVRHDDEKVEQNVIISNMTKVSNAEPGCTFKLRESNVQEIIEQELIGLIKRYEINFIDVMNDKISSEYSKLSIDLDREVKYLNILTAQINVLGKWKDDIEKIVGGPIIEMNNITSSINEINKLMDFANAAQRKELLGKKESLSSKKQQLLIAWPNISIDVDKYVHKLNQLEQINDELARVEYDLAVQSKRSSYLESSTQAHSLL